MSAQHFHIERSPSLKNVKPGTWRQKPMKEGHGGVLLTGWLAHGWLSLLFNTHRKPEPLTSVTSQENALQTFIKASPMASSSGLRLLLPIDPSLCQTDMKRSQHSTSGTASCRSLQSCVCTRWRQVFSVICSLYPSASQRIFLPVDTPIAVRVTYRSLWSVSSSTSRMTPSTQSKGARIPDT